MCEVSAHDVCVTDLADGGSAWLLDSRLCNPVMHSGIWSWIAFLCMQAAVKAASGKGRGAKRKPQPTVRERLTKKLLSGKARGQTLGEVESAADERFQEVNSNRWQATRFP